MFFVVVVFFLVIIVCGVPAAVHGVFHINLR